MSNRQHTWRTCEQCNVTYCVDCGGDDGATDRLCGECNKPDAQQLTELEKAVIADVLGGILNENSERARFQRWWGTRFPAETFKRTSKSGAYDNNHINNAWIVWISAKKDTQIPTDGRSYSQEGGRIIHEENKGRLPLRLHKPGTE